MARTLLVFCLPLLILAPAQAESKPDAKQAAIEKAVKENLDAAQKLDWTAYAQTIHPDCLKGFKADLEPVLKAAAKKGGETEAGLVAMFDGGKDLKTVQAWQPREFFTRFMKGVSKTPAGSFIAARTTRVVGTVREGDEAHVVIRVRQKVGKGEITRVDVVTVKRDGAAWKVILPGELRGLAQTLKLSVGAVETQTRKDEALPDCGQ